jgi:hypothetical protein
MYHRLQSEQLISEIVMDQSKWIVITELPYSKLKIYTHGHENVLSLVESYMTSNFPDMSIKDSVVEKEGGTKKEYLLLTIDTGNKIVKYQGFKPAFFVLVVTRILKRYIFNPSKWKICSNGNFMCVIRGLACVEQNYRDLMIKCLLSLSLYDFLHQEKFPLDGVLYAHFGDRDLSIIWHSCHGKTKRWFGCSKKCFRCLGYLCTYVEIERVVNQEDVKKVLPITENNE